MAQITIAISMDEDYLHMSRPGRPGLGFDTGDAGEEMTLAIDDLATELKKIYKSEIKKGQA